MMPMTPHADATVLEKLYREANEPFKSIEWELEDLLGSRAALRVLAKNIRMPFLVSREQRMLYTVILLVTVRRGCTDS